MTATQYYVFSEDTSTGIQYIVTTEANWNGPGVRVGGPYATKAAAQAFIKSGNAATGLSNTILTQDQADVGDWIVVPEGELGKVTQALAYVSSAPLTALVGSFKGNLAIGGDVTVTQLTTAQQVQNAETANLTLYPTKAAAQAAADTANGKTNPQQSASWEQTIANFFEALSNAHTWIRVAEVVIGGALLIVTLDKLLSSTPAGPAAHKVAKAAFLA
jgi:hypothetical protein